MSPYWDKVSNIAVTLHGGALETITITGLYDSPTVTTNSDGNVSYYLPNGTYTFTGSVSGESFTRTVTSDTTDVYVMPEGLVPYWFGWCNPLTPDITEPISLGLFEITILTNGIKSKRAVGNYSNCNTRDYNLDISSCSKLNAVYNEIANISADFYCMVDNEKVIFCQYNNLRNSPCYNKRVSIDTNGATTAVRFGYECSGNNDSTAYYVLGAFWFE